MSGISEIIKIHKIEESDEDILKQWEKIGLIPDIDKKEKIWLAKNLNLCADILINDLHTKGEIETLIFPAIHRIFQKNHSIFTKENIIELYNTLEMFVNKYHFQMYDINYQSFDAEVEYLACFCIIFEFGIDFNYLTNKVDEYFKNFNKILEKIEHNEHI